MTDTRTRATDTRADRQPLGYSSETVLTIEQVAEWLQVSKRSAERLNLKPFYLGTRTRRYLAKHVLEYIEAKAAA